MKAESADRLVIAFDRAAAEAGGTDSLETAIDEVIRFLDGVLNRLRSCATKAQVREMLLQTEEPSPVLMRLAEGSMVHLPRIMRGWLRHTARRVASRPEDRGRRPSISVDQHWEVCQQVSDLEFRGSSLGQAKRTIARKYQVTYRTIHRIWKNRAHLTQSTVTIKQAEAWARELINGPQPTESSKAIIPMEKATRKKC